MTITNFAFLLVAISVACYVACFIVNAIGFRKTNAETYKAMFDKLNNGFKIDKGGEYLVTKEWYVDGHKSSEIVEASDAAAAYQKQSDDHRNLDYYIKSVEKV